MRFKIVFSIYFAILVSCQTPIIIQNNKSDYSTERLNKQALINAKNQDNKNRFVKVDTSYNPLHNRVVSGHYMELNKKNNERTYISWGDTYATKKVLKSGDSIIRYSHFYGNGNLKSSYNKFVGKINIDENDNLIYNAGYNVVIGKLYDYDEEGNLKNIYDYDFTFSIFDLRNFLEKKYVTDANKVAIRQFRDFETQEILWEVVYEDDSKNYPQLLIIDSKTGKVLEKKDYIVKEM